MIVGTQTRMWERDRRKICVQLFITENYRERGRWWRKKKAKLFKRLYFIIIIIFLLRWMQEWSMSIGHINVIAIMLDSRISKKCGEMRREGKMYFLRICFACNCEWCRGTMCDYWLFKLQFKLTFTNLAL